MGGESRGERFSAIDQYGANDRYGAECTFHYDLTPYSRK